MSSWRRISPDSLIPHSKASGQYLNSVLAKIESIKAGYEEAILLDDNGHVCEGTGENVFVIKDGVIYTPRPDGGDPRRHQPQVGASRSPRDLGYEVVERDIARAELALADEVFLTGTAAELTPVREIDDIEIGAARPDHARRSRASSTTRCTAATPRYAEWLDLVPVPSQA